MLQVSDQVFRVPPLVLDSVWRVVAEMLQACPESWDIANSLETIYQGIASSSYDLWVARNSYGTITLAALGILETYPKCRAYRVAWIGGKAEPKVLQLGLHAIETAAVSHGATYLVADGRRGLERMLAPLGFKFNSVSVVKPLLVEKVH